MKYKTKIIFSLAITASILSTLSPLSIHAMMQESGKSNIQNSGYTENNQNIISLHFTNSHNKHYFLPLLGNSTVADVIRLFESKYNLEVTGLWTKKSKIPDNMTVNDIREKYGNNIYLDHPDLMSSQYRAEISENSASIGYNENTNNFGAFGDFQSGGFGSKIPQCSLLPNLASKEVPIQQVSIRKEKEVTETKEDLSPFKPEIVKQVRKTLANPNDQKELIRRLNGLKLISLKPIKKEVDVIKEISQIENEFTPEQKNICLQLKDKFCVSYYTAVQVFALSNFSEYKAQILLKQFEPEPCF